ncbi:MAG: lytic transglycosylase domain-containing protein [Deltaproteobacteria bacterium]|nr:lytic transglycosylase domain-containing protein [Deltaproteobacteria bacterium]
MSPAHAEIYRYLDEHGVWNFSNVKRDARYKRWSVGHEKFELDDVMSEVLGSGPYDDIFIEAGRRTLIPPALLKAMAAQESGFNPRAISPKGALGLMQLMPATAKLLGVDAPFDPEQSIHGGARFLRMLLDTFANNAKLAVAAYNCGEGPVRRALDVPNIEETQDYVRRVFRFYAAYSGAPIEDDILRPPPASQPVEHAREP